MFCFKLDFEEDFCFFVLIEVFIFVGYLLQRGVTDKGGTY